MIKFHDIKFVGIVPWLMVFFKADESQEDRFLTPTGKQEHLISIYFSLVPQRSAYLILT